MDQNSEFTGEYYYPQYNPSNFRIPLRQEAERSGSSSVFYNEVLDNESQNQISQDNRFRARTNHLGKRKNEPAPPLPPDEDDPMGEEVPLTKKPRIGSALRTMLQEDFPEDLKALMKPLKCLLCKVEVNSIVMSNIHYQSKNHDKKLNNWLQEWSKKSGIPIPDRQKQLVKTEGATGPNAYHCEACDIPLTSLQHAQAHYSGRKHRAVVEGRQNPSGSGYYNHEGKWVRQATKVKQDSTGRFGIGEAFIKPPPPPPPPPLAPEASGTSSTASSSLYCQLCNISVTSEGQMKTHLEGAKHSKKLKASTEATIPPMNDDTIMESVQSGKQPAKMDTSIHRTPSGNYYCNVCDITTPNEVHFFQHLGSKKHLKKLKGSQGK